MASNDDHLSRNIERNLQTSKDNIKKIVDEMTMVTKEIQHNQRSLADTKQKAEHFLTQIETTRRALRDLENGYEEIKKEYDEGRQQIEQKNKRVKMLGDQARGLKSEREKLQKELERVISSIKEEEEANSTRRY